MEPILFDQLIQIPVKNKMIVNMFIYTYSVPEMNQVISTQVLKRGGLRTIFKIFMNRYVTSFLHLSHILNARCCHK